jgi:amino acid transporter
VINIWQTAMSQTWAEALLFICCVAQFFCLTASVTSASRMMFAFSRDGAVPGHRLWRRVASNRVPYLAVIAIGVLAFALMIPTYWNAYTGYLVGTSIAVIGLYIAFILPVILRWRRGRDWEPGAWSLGAHYKWIDPLAILWVAFISILFLLPFAPGGVPFKSNPGWNWDVVNYAPATVGGALILFGGWYLLSARHWFKGPVRMGSEEELERIEAQYGGSPPAAPVHGA